MNQQTIEDFVLEQISFGLHFIDRLADQHDA
jgi:hypothetical protein